jgi:uncharacterized membrane protein
MKKLRWLAALLISGVSFLIPSIAHANLQDFTITNFAGDYTLTDEDPQGVLKVKERIEVVFTDNNHGIERALPSRYKGQEQHIKNIRTTKPDGTAWPFTTRSSNGNLVIRIGDPSRTVTGAQTFILEYQQQNVVSFYDDHNELYWDINGDQWLQPFTKVSATFHLPAGMVSESTRKECFAGSYGSSDKFCRIEIGDKKITVASTKTLLPGQTLTAVFDLGTEKFRPTTLMDWVKENTIQLIGAVGLPVFAFVIGFRKWWKFGRDPKGRGTIVPQFEPPTSVSPAMAGVLLDFRADNKDISATIIDLAIRGYVKIVEKKKIKKFAKDTLEYSILLHKSETSGLSSYESALLSSLFTEMSAGAEVSLNKSSTERYNNVQKVRKDVEKTAETIGFIAPSIIKLKVTPVIFWLIIFVLSFVIKGWFIFGAVVALAILVAFSAIMKRRTVDGVLAIEQLHGLRMYMEVAEKDRIKMLQGPDAKYAGPKGPKHTVELFEKLLPYAVVLGVEKQWAKQFENIYKSPPDWYNGHWSGFNTGLLVGSMNRSMNAINTSFSPPSSSGSSGFGGGGFSGGGGGGGGGGGW